MQVSDKPSDLFARFEPWLPTLQRLRAPTYGWTVFPDDFVGPRVVWFAGDAFFDSDAAKEPLDSVCEALSLLTLLARVDFHAWKKTVLKIWPADWRFMELLERLVPSERFVVGFGVSELNNQSIKSIVRFRDYNASEECPSEEYMRLQEDLETVIRPRGREEEDEKDYLKIRVTVELDCSNGRGRAAAAMLQRTLNHVKEEQAMTLSRGAEDEELVDASKRPFFTITNVAFATTVGVKLGMAGLKLLQELAPLGIRLSHLPPLKIDPTARQICDFIQALRDIVCLDDAETVGARTVTINDQYAPDLMRSLLTVVQHSSKVQALEIDLGNGEDDEMFDDQSHVWTWVALTIFSKCANHNIDTLEVHVERLQDVEVDAVRRVLQAPNPYSAAIGRASLGLSDSTPHQITATRFFIDETNEEPTLLFETRQPIAVRVLEAPVKDYHPYWTVLLPGHQLTAVHEDDVLSSSTDDLHLENRQATPTPTFRRIDIAKMSEDSMEPVADLLELIGKETKRIDLYEQIDDSPVDSWCQRVLASCPRLEEFQVRHASVDDLEAFTVAASQSQCRLRELLMSIVPTRDSDQRVRVFFDALSDPNHPLTENLRQLDLGLYVETETAKEIYEPILRMLRLNRRLVGVHLRIELPGPARALLPDFMEAFDGISSEVVSIRTGSLGILNKLAFLSVVDRVARDGGSSAVGGLDASILSMVFQYAAEGRARSVTVMYGEPLGGEDEDQEREEEEE